MEKIDINKLTPDQHQALVCMFFAMIPKTDTRYRKRNAYWEILQKRFNKKVTTYKHAKDAFDFYFPNPDKPEKILQFLHISSTIKKNVGGCVHVTYR